MVDPPTVDFAAKALADAQDRLREEQPDANQSGLLWSVREVLDEVGGSDG